MLRLGSYQDIKADTLSVGPMKTHVFTSPPGVSEGHASFSITGMACPCIWAVSSLLAGTVCHLAAPRTWHTEATSDHDWSQESSCTVNN